MFSGSTEYWGDATGPDGKTISTYPADAPVMDHHGRLHQGLTADNPFPICVAKPIDPTAVQDADTVLKSIAVGGAGGTLIPYCPPDFLIEANRLDDGGLAAPETFPDARRWAARGAINAAMAVFLYLDDIERHPEKRKPLYNQCDQLAAGNK